MYVEGSLYNLFYFRIAKGALQSMFSQNTLSVRRLRTASLEDDPQPPVYGSPD